MNNTTFSAALSGAVAVIAAVITAGLTYSLTKKREREADWRKLKLECYGEYVAALSGAVKGPEPNAEARARYANAVNGIALVAPMSILKALYAFQDEKGVGSRRNELLNNLMNALRHDIDPRPPRRKDIVAVRFMGVDSTPAVASELSLDKKI